MPSNSSKLRHRHWPKLLVALTILVSVGLITHTLLARRAAAAEAPLINPPSAVALSNLNNQINQLISNDSAVTTSVSLADLNTGSAQQYGVNGTAVAASISKILTAVAFLHQVETGHESLNENLGGSNAKYLLQQMIVVSDDNAWESLNSELGYPLIANYATSLGIGDYNWQTNSLSAQDVTNLLTKLWDYKLLNKTDTNLLLGYMNQANYTNFMMPAIPASDTVYHKVGLIDDNVNEAAIIVHNRNAVVLTIFTNGNGTYDWTDRASLLQAITKAVLATYFKQ